MIGHLWSIGVAIDPGRLIDDSDTAYLLTVISAYRNLMHRREETAAAEAAHASQRTA